MATRRAQHRANSQIEPQPLDIAQQAFFRLVTGPHPVAVDGRLFTGLPDRPVPLDDLRDRLLRRTCPMRVRDAVWAHLVLRSRLEGGTWTVGCVGMAMPALLAATAKLSAAVAGDPSDVHAAVLEGFLTELAKINLRKPKIALRLRWAAYRAGHACVRDALDAPMPIGTGGYSSTPPPPPFGHPDLVLLRAVADGVLTAEEAELIGSTRLERRSLAEAAAARGSNAGAVQVARRRAERRLLAYLTEGSGTACDDTQVAGQALGAATIATAAQAGPPSRTLTGTARGSGKKVRAGVLETASKSGVKGCGGTEDPSRLDPRSRPSAGTGSTQEVRRCA